MFRLLGFSMLMLACAAAVDTITTRHVHTVVDPDPAEPTQPLDMILVVTNYCNTTVTRSKDNYNLWEGTYVVDPPDTIASQHSEKFKYGFEVKAVSSSKRINGTVLYTGAGSIFIDFFAVPNEWGVSISHSTSLAVETTSADVGPLSVYNIMVGHGQTC